MNGKHVFSSMCYCFLLLCFSRLKSNSPKLKEEVLAFLAADMLRFNVTTLAGDTFDKQLPGNASGSDLVEELAKKYAPYGSQRLVLACIGKTPVSLDESLGSQASKYGNIVTLVTKQIQAAEQMQVSWTEQLLVVIAEQMQVG